MDTAASEKVFLEKEEGEGGTQVNEQKKSFRFWKFI